MGRERLNTDHLVLSIQIGSCNLWDDAAAVLAEASAEGTRRGLAVRQTGCDGRCDEGVRLVLEKDGVEVARATHVRPGEAARVLDGWLAGDLREPAPVPGPAWPWLMGRLVPEDAEAALGAGRYGGLGTPVERGAALAWLDSALAALPADLRPAPPEGGPETITVAEPGSDPVPGPAVHLLEGDPHAVLSGLLLICDILGAPQATVELPDGLPLLARRVQGAVESLRTLHEAGRLPVHHLPAIRVRTVASSPCGDGPVPRPGSWRVRPEALARIGEAWTRSRSGPTGPADGADGVLSRRLLVVTGDARRRGILEIEPEESLREIIHGDLGGLLPGRRLRGVILGGYRGVALAGDDLDRPLSACDLASGRAPALLVLSARSCPVNMARLHVRLQAADACSHGQEPYLQAADRALARLSAGDGDDTDLAALAGAARGLKATGCAAGRAAGELLESLLERFAGEFRAHVQGYCPASICSDLLATPCQNACPAGVNVAGHLSLLRQGRARAALALGRASNPFLVTCGHVCEDPPCTHVCRRAQVDRPVDIPVVHRLAAAAARERDRPARPSRLASPPPSARGGTQGSARRVAVVGAGPAGLTAALFLSRYGHHVVVYERLPVAGGMLAVGIPPYRLPRAVLEEELGLIREAGVVIETGRELGRNLEFARLREEFDAVVLALGAHRSLTPGVPGEDLDGVLSGLEFLRRVHLGEPVRVGPRVVVIGGGNVALDAARVAWRLGAEEVHVACLEDRDRMPSHETEVAEALEEGVVLHAGLGPVAFEGNGRVRAVRLRPAVQVWDRQGRFRPVLAEGGDVELAADTVLLCIGQQPDLSGLAHDREVLAPDGRWIRTGADGVSTPIPGVFAAGDAVTGTRTVVEAVRAGHLAARAVERYLGGDPVRAEARLFAGLRWPTPPHRVDMGVAPDPADGRAPASERRRLDRLVRLVPEGPAAARELALCLCIATPGVGYFHEEGR